MLENSNFLNDSGGRGRIKSPLGCFLLAYVFIYCHAPALQHRLGHTTVAIYARD